MPLIKERVSKKATLIAAMVWCILLLVNAWIFLHRSEGYNYRRLATYDELYVPSEKQHIKKLYFKSDSAIIEMAKPLNAQAWRFVRDDSIVDQALVNGRSVAIPLKKGMHTYHFVASGMNQPAFECALDFVCESNGGPSHCRNEWLYCSLPMPVVPTLSLNVWWDKKSFANDETTMSTGLPFSEKDQSRPSGWEAAIRYLHQMNRTDSGNLLPDSLVASLSTPSLVQQAVSRQYKLDCGEFTWFAHYLFNALQIPNRAVGFNATDDNWRTGEHYLLEAFVPSKQQWGVVDGLLDLYFPQDSSGNLLSAADLRKLMELNASLEGFVAYAANNDSLSTVPLSNWRTPLRRYYGNPYSHMRFWDVRQSMPQNSWRDRIMRYATTDQSVVIFSDRLHNHWGKILLKMVALYGFIFYSIGLLFLFWGTRRLRRN